MTRTKWLLAALISRRGFVFVFVAMLMPVAYLLIVPRQHFLTIRADTSYFTFDPAGVNSAFELFGDFRLELVQPGNKASVDYPALNDVATAVHLQNSKFSVATTRQEPLSVRITLLEVREQESRTPSVWRQDYERDWDGKCPVPTDKTESEERDLRCPRYLARNDYLVIPADSRKTVPQIALMDGYVSFGIGERQSIFSSGHLVYEFKEVLGWDFLPARFRHQSIRSGEIFDSNSVKIQTGGGEPAAVNAFVNLAQANAGGDFLVQVDAVSDRLKLVQTSSGQQMEIAPTLGDRLQNDVLLRIVSIAFAALVFIMDFAASAYFRSRK